jgi:hypothetical protein
MLGTQWMINTTKVTGDGAQAFLDGKDIVHDNPWKHDEAYDPYFIWRCGFILAQWNARGVPAPSIQEF